MERVAYSAVLAATAADTPSVSDEEELWFINSKADLTPENIEDMVSAAEKSARVYENIGGSYLADNLRRLNTGFTVEQSLRLIQLANTAQWTPDKDEHPLSDLMCAGGIFPLSRRHVVEAIRLGVYYGGNWTNKIPGLSRDDVQACLEYCLARQKLSFDDIRRDLHPKYNAESYNDVLDEIKNYLKRAIKYVQDRDRR